MLPISEGMKVLVEQHKTSVISPFVYQQVWMQINHLEFQIPGRQTPPARRTVPLSRIGAQDPQRHLKKRLLLFNVNDSKLMHVLQHSLSKARKCPHLFGVWLDHEDASGPPMVGRVPFLHSDEQTVAGCANFPCGGHRQLDQNPVA